MPAWYAELRVPILFVQSFIGIQIFIYSIKQKCSKPILTLWVFGGACVCYLGKYLFPCEPTDVSSRICYSILVYVVCVAVTFFTNHLSLFSCLFVSASGYIAQDICGTVKTILKIIPTINQASENAFGILALDLLCYGGILAFLFYIFRPITSHPNENFDDRIKAIFSVFILFLCIGMARITQGNESRNTISCFAESIYGIICDVLILFVQFGTMEHANLTHSLKTMELAIHQQKQQYKSEKDHIALINEKYHDLKSLISRNSIPISKVQLEHLGDSIGGYELFAQTGNDILDVVFTEKAKLCKEQGISFTYFLDGQQLMFLSDLDAYSLFSNALNNAIEASATLPSSQRFILVRMDKQSSFIFLHIENAFSGFIDSNNSLPKTTKANVKEHGFGIKSMRNIAQKYKGSLSICCKDQIFCLDIVLDSRC